MSKKREKTKGHKTFKDVIHINITKKKYIFFSHSSITTPPKVLVNKLPKSLDRKTRLSGNTFV